MLPTAFDTVFGLLVMVLVIVSIIAVVLLVIVLSKLVRNSRGKDLSIRMVSKE